MPNKLQEAGDKAELLCQSLRQKGYEAWVFHDRSESVVTVGSFQSIGNQRKDGKTEMDPQIHHIMKTFGPESKTKVIQAGAKPADLIPKITQVSYNNIETQIVLDMQPIPIQVPKPRGLVLRMQSSR